MAVTPSHMLPLGTQAPDFSLLDTVSGDVKKLDDLKSPQATVILFICNHCPYVKHLQAAIVNLANEYQEKGAAFIAINANDATQYPDDSPEKMTIEAQEQQYHFPYLYDASQAVAKAYQAACTPDFYIFDQGLRCVYRGRFDASTPGNNIPITGEDLRSALNCVLSNEPVNKDQKPSIGCNIKWKNNAD